MSCPLPPSGWRHDNTEDPRWEVERHAVRGGQGRRQVPGVRGADVRGEDQRAVPNEDGTVGHAEVTVGESVLMTFDAAPDWPDTPAFLSVYVDDVERTYQRALDAGATVVTELLDSRI